MKIFNWVHRRFHQKDDHVGAKSEVVAGNGRDKVSLLDENAGLDSSVFDGWKEGILSIGTLGLDPALFKDFKPDQDDDDHMYLCEINPKELFIDDDDEMERSEMEFPLVLKACKHGFFHDHKDDPCIIHQTYCTKPNNNNNNNNDDDDDDEDGLDTSDDQVRKDERKAGERITLADLFWADSENNLLKKKKKNKLADHVKMVHNYDHATTESNIKHASNDHDRVALISKKNPARPIKKINRLVRKMLKKKIHPEVENQKEIARRKNIPIRVSGSVKNEY